MFSRPPQSAALKSQSRPRSNDRTPATAQIRTRLLGCVRPNIAIAVAAINTTTAMPSSIGAHYLRAGPSGTQNVALRTKSTTSHGADNLPRDTRDAIATGTVTGVTIPPGRDHPRRPLLERVVAPVPWLLRFGLLILAHLSPTSRLRQRALQEVFSRVFSAINRSDPWPVPIGYEPDCEIYPAAGFRTLGLEACYRGHSGWRQVIDAAEEPFADVRWEPDRLIDLGDRWVVRLRMSGSGRSSGAHLQQTWGSVYHLSSRGRVTRQDVYWTWEETLTAAGLREDR